MLFGSSGIRRKFDQTLIDTALRVGSALASQSTDILVGMDTRTTSPLLSHLVLSGILGSGGTAHSTGIAPTPSVAYFTRTVNAGCMITASHNPEEYNGLKLFNPDGSSFTLAQQAEMEELLKTRHWTDWQHQGHERKIDALTPHKNAILEEVHIRAGIPVVVDCGNGAGSVLTPALLGDAGAKTLCINCNPSGNFARPSEPLKENVAYVGEMVKKTGSACGVVHDGDADRMMAFDNKGRYIDGDHLLMLFARYLEAKKVVTTSDASMSRKSFLNGGISAVNRPVHGFSRRSRIVPTAHTRRLFSVKSLRNGMFLGNLMPCHPTRFSGNHLPVIPQGKRFWRWEPTARLTGSESLKMMAGT